MAYRYSFSMRKAMKIGALHRTFTTKHGGHEINRPNLIVSLKELKHKEFPVSPYKGLFFRSASTFPSASHTSSSENLDGNEVGLRDHFSSSSSDHWSMSGGPGAGIYGGNDDDSLDPSKFKMKPVKVREDEIDVDDEDMDVSGDDLDIDI